MVELEISKRMGLPVWMDEHSPRLQNVAVCVVQHALSPLVLAVSRREAPEILCMPGGRIEDGETARQAVIRELFEEAGARSRPKDLRWLGSIDVESRHGGAHAVGVFWVLAPVGYQPRPGLGEPAMRPRWHDWADLADASRHGRFAGPALLARICMGAIKPSDIALRAVYAPLTDAFGNIESEQAAGMMIRALAATGDEWRPISMDEVSAYFRTLNAADLYGFSNPTLRPDVYELARRGFARWHGEPSASTPVEFTESGIDRLALHRRLSNV